jgi:hypothetical protein
MNPTVAQPQEIVSVTSTDNTTSSSDNDGSIDHNIVSGTSDDDVLNNSANQPVWCSTRIRGPPSHLSDYHIDVVNSKNNCTKYPISHSICYDKWSKNYQHYILNLNCFSEPTSYAIASQDPQCVEAMNAELSANRTWSLVPLPKSKMAIGSK